MTRFRQSPLAGSASSSSLLAASARADEPRWKQHTINGQSEFEAAGVFDVDNDGQLDIVSGDTWYQAPDWKPYHVRDVARIGTYYNDFATLPARRQRRRPYATSSPARTSARTWAGSRTPGKPARPGPITRSTSPATSRRPGWSTSRATACPISCPTRSTWSSGTRSSRRPMAQGYEFKKHDFGNAGGRTRRRLGRRQRRRPHRPAHAQGLVRGPGRSCARHRGPGTPNGRLGATGIQILARDVDGDGLSDVVYGMGHDYGLFWLQQAKSSGGERTWTKQADRQVDRLGPHACSGPTSTATARPTSW